MDAREGGGPTGAVRTPDRPDVGGPACHRPSDPADDESGERGDAETYAVLGED